MSNNEFDNIDELVSDIKTHKIQPVDVPTGKEMKTKEEIQDFVTKKLSQVMEIGVDALISAKNTIDVGGDSADLAALAATIKNLGDVGDKLMKIAQQDKQIEANRELKMMEVDTVKTISDNAVKQRFIGTREDMIKRKKEKELIDVSVDVTTKT